MRNLYFSLQIVKSAGLGKIIVDFKSLRSVNDWVPVEFEIWSVWITIFVRVFFSYIFILGFKISAGDWLRHKWALSR